MKRKVIVIITLVLFFFTPNVNLTYSDTVKDSTLFAEVIQQSGHTYDQETGEETHGHEHDDGHEH